MKYLFLLFLFLCSDLKSQENTTLKQEIDQHQKGIGLWWTGHNGWIIKSNDLVISTDILLNYDKRINKPSCHCKPGDSISVRENSLSKDLVNRYLSSAKPNTQRKDTRNVGIPPNLSFRKSDLTGQVQGVTRRGWLGVRVSDLYIIEYYSRRGRKS